MRGLARAMRVCKWLMVALGVAAAVTAALGQVLHATGALPAFEVISVRPSAPNASFQYADFFALSNDGVRATNVTVKQTIMYAYGLVKDDELSGGPKWIDVDRFDVEARVDKATAAAWSQLTWRDKDEQTRLRMQTLLQERFGLKIKFVTKVLPVWALTVEKRGFKCTLTKTASPVASESKPRYGTAPPPPPPPPPGYVPPSPEEMRALQQSPHWTPKGWPFWLMVSFLGAQPELDGRIVVDRTGLSGAYDCDVAWTRLGAETPGPSLFAAVREEMGLNFTSAKAPVETVEIESVTLPSKN